MNFDFVFVHLLNDYSGSPKVLKETISAIICHPGQAKLYVGSSGSGILSHSGIPIQRYWYIRSRHRLLTFITYFISQLSLFTKLLVDRSIDRKAIVYVNTLLPLGAALYGRLTGRKVIYHIHEISISPVLLKKLLTSIARITSSLNLYVSDAHIQAMPIPGVPARRVYNSLDPEFLHKASSISYAHRHEGCFSVLMITYLRDYKGVPELLDLTTHLLGQCDICFVLVVSDDAATIKNYFSNKDIPVNLKIHPKTATPLVFYESASLVLNLSRVDQCVETFGLTILEAMSFGIPVIAPPVGGPTELVDNGLNGYLIDSRNTKELVSKIVELANNPELCLQLSNSAREKAKYFSPEKFKKDILDAINSVVPA